MKLSAEIRKKLQDILGFKYEDDNYEEADLKEIVDDLIEAVEEWKEKLHELEVDVAENYEYTGGREYDDY